MYRESIGQGLRVGQHAVSPQALYTPLVRRSECSARASCALRLPQGSVSLAWRANGNPSRCVALLCTKNTFLKTLMVVGGGFYVVISFSITDGILVCFG